jgi:hypothetical protein
MSEVRVKEKGVRYRASGVRGTWVGVARAGLTADAVTGTSSSPTCVRVGLTPDP